MMFLVTLGAVSPTIFFFFNDTATTEIYTLSLHDALPICRIPRAAAAGHHLPDSEHEPELVRREDRKSTRLNSSHLGISYAVFCLKKKRQIYSCRFASLICLLH